MKVYTIGHSNLSPGTFLALLLGNGVEVLIDVRRVPRSRFEHFNAENLRIELQKAGIEYIHIPGLGGFRKKVLANSPNIAIRSKGFRNYADFMLTEEFEKEIEKVIEIAAHKTCALMCAEKFFWKCHRKFLADYLTLRGFIVFHILDNGILPHRISENARIAGGKLIYDLEI